MDNEKEHGSLLYHYISSGGVVWCHRAAKSSGPPTQIPAA